MKALLVQQGFQDALKDEKDLPKTLLKKEKNDILEKAQKCHYPESWRQGP